LWYRRNLKGGAWYARRHNEGTTQYTFAEIGLADDLTDADGVRVLTRDQAAQKAREWFTEVNEGSAGISSRKPYTVADAADAWLKTQTAPTGAIHVKNHIRTQLGHIVLSKLTKPTLYDWLQALAVKPPAWTLAPKCKKPFDINNPETLRQRKENANRVLRTLRAILNLAYSNEKVKSQTAWSTLKEFPDVAKLRTEYLTVEEGSRFIEVCPLDFRKLVQGALFTGCRYGELCKLKVEAFNTQIACLTVMQGKTHKTKEVYLTPEEADFFEDQTNGKRLDDYMFLRSDGTEWKKDNQRERMKAACIAAHIEKHITFHNLRHTFASLLAMGGTRPELVRLQMGHSSLRMTDRYTHFSPSVVADTIRANKPSFLHDNNHGPVLVAKAG
jgi:integrase